MKQTVFFLLLVHAVKSFAQGCSSCGGPAQSALQRADDCGPFFHVTVGATQYGQPAGDLFFSSGSPDPVLYTPQALTRTTTPTSASAPPRPMAPIGFTITTPWARSAPGINSGPMAAPWPGSTSTTLSTTSATAPKPWPGVTKTAGTSASPLTT